jgi:hypothetical protein
MSFGFSRVKAAVEEVAVDDMTVCEASRRVTIPVNVSDIRGSVRSDTHSRVR